MQRAEIMEKLKAAITIWMKKRLTGLVDVGLGAGFKPIHIIQDGLSPGLAVIGDGFKNGSGSLVTWL